MRFVGALEEILLPFVDLRRKKEFLVVESLKVLSELTKVFDFSVDFSVTLSSSSASSVIVVMLFLCDLYFPPKKKQLVVLHPL